MSDASITARRVLDLLLEQPRALSVSEVRELLFCWLNEFPAYEKCGSESYSDMHIVGSAICMILNKHSPDWDELGSEKEVQQLCPSLLCISCKTCVLQMTPGQLQDVVMNLQLKFSSLYHETPSGIESEFDINCFLLLLMKRLGYWLSVNIKNAESTMLSFLEPVPRHEGVSRVRPEVVVQILDALHTILAFNRFLVTATPVESQEDIEVNTFHLEASMDTFYEMCTVADCGVGTIVQYQHKFKDLFHSVTQVIYYHYPSYQRNTQKPLSELQDVVAKKKNLPSTNILPLAMQIYPDVPLLWEHTGATNKEVLKKNKWNWVQVQHLIVLVRNDMCSYCGKISDLVSLLD